MSDLLSFPYINCYTSPMGLFGVKRPSQTVALIDISSASVRGAYAHIEEGKAPGIYYTAYIPIDIGSGQSAEVADPVAADMLRSLERLAERLVRDGAPLLKSELGTARVDSVLVSIGAPWQRTTVRVESIRKDQPFVFNRAFIDQALKSNDATLPEGHIEAGEVVIATLLNGYETAKPFGKRAKRADLIVLNSTLAKDVSEAVTRVLRRTYHTHAIHTTAFAPVAYEILRDVYQHHKDFLVLDVAGTATDLAFIKENVLVDVCTLDTGVHDLLRAARAGGVMGTGMPGLAAGGQSIIDPSRNARFSDKMNSVQTAWLAELRSAFTDFASRHPLPRTLFLLADSDTRDFLKRTLDDEGLRSLWLSEEPLQIVPVLAEQFSSLVKTRAGASGDAYIAMLALYYQRRIAHIAAASATPEVATPEKPIHTEGA